MSIFFLLGVGIVFGSFLCWSLISMVINEDCGVVLIEYDTNKESEVEL